MRQRELCKWRENGKFEITKPCSLFLGFFHALGRCHIDWYLILKHLQIFLPTQYVQNHQNKLQNPYFDLL